MNMRKFTAILVFPALVSAASRSCFALDQAGLTSEFSLPDRARNLADTQDEYYNAVQLLQDADAAVVRARESAMREAQSQPDYVAAVKAVDAAYQAFITKKNAMVADLEKTNPMYSQMKGQIAAIDAKIQSARQNPDTPARDFDDLYANRETFVKQWHQQENDAMDREKITPLRQSWIDASKKLSDLQDQQRVVVEGNERLKTAVRNAEEAKAAVEQARTAIQGAAANADAAGNERAGAGDFLRKYSRAGFAGNDAWWTYGWSAVNAGVKPAMAVPAK